MSDDTLPVEEHEPIPPEDNEAIIAGVVNGGAAPAVPSRSPFSDPRVMWAAVVAFACFALISALSTIAQWQTADDQERLAASQERLAADVAAQRETEECWVRLDAAADVARVTFNVGAAQQHDAAWQAVLAYARGDVATAEAKAAEAEALSVQLEALAAQVRAAVDAYQQGVGPCATTTTTAPA